MATLYDLTGAYKRLYEELSGGELDDETFEQAFSDTLEAAGFDEEFEDKADGYAKIISMLNADYEGVTAEKERLDKRAKAIKNNIDRTKKRLQFAMAECGKPKFRTLLFSFNIQKNPPSEVIEDESKISEEYLIKQAPKIDKAAIKKAIAAGKEVSGASLKQSESLRIR